VVPEVYDPTTDRNIALENARMAFPPYPQAEVVQIGPGREDWEVCTFNGEINGTAAARPTIVTAPSEIAYRGYFDLTVAGDPSNVGAVVLLRSDHNTHCLTAGDRYVKLAIHRKGTASHNELRAVTPKLPAQAVPGIDLLSSSTIAACRAWARRSSFGILTTS
jgi:hypothetical protein